MPTLVEMLANGRRIKPQPTGLAGSLYQGMTHTPGPVNPWPGVGRGLESARQGIEGALVTPDMLDFINQRDALMAGPGTPGEKAAASLDLIGEHPGGAEFALNFGDALTIGPAKVGGKMFKRLKGAGNKLHDLSRMARADDMFPIDAYHGSGNDISKFGETTFLTETPAGADTYAMSRFGNKVPIFGDSLSMKRPWDRPVKGYEYEQATMYPLRVSAEKTAGPEDIYRAAKAAGMDKKILDNALPYQLVDTRYSGLDDPNASRKVVDALKEKGFDSARFPDDAADGGRLTSLVIFDPKNIRSRFAKFDPKMRHSANILASGGAAALMAPGLLADDQPGPITASLRGNR